MDKGNILNDIIEKPKPLSGEQQEALLSTSRYVRIVAGAGTGKTETLTRRIAYLLLCKNIDPTRIVAFTFTEKAAQSMKSRLFERVRQLRGEEACARLGEMYLGTIHGFCLRILEDHYGYGDHTVLNENQEMAFVLREGWSLGLGGNGRYSENCRNFIRSVNVVFDELIDREELRNREEKFSGHLEAYEELLGQHRLLTFGQMIHLTVQNLKSEPGHLGPIEHLIVDEYQDINKAQEALIKLIASKSSVFIVGDPRQSIYQWRGSDEACFERFSQEFSGCHNVNITENRRSVKRVVEVANAFAATFEGVKYRDISPKRKRDGGCFILEAGTPEEEAEWVVSQIEEHVNGEKCSHRDIGILLRSVTTSAGPFIDLLRERKIPYLVGGKVGLFRREEAQAVGRLFAWLPDKGFWVENPWNWKERTKGDELFQTAAMNWSLATGITFSKARTRRLEEWAGAVLDGDFKNFTDAYQHLLLLLGYLDLDPGDTLQAAVMANLGRFNSLLTDYESSIRFGGRQIKWPRALNGLCWYMNSYASSAYDEQPSEDIRGIDAVQIMTVHQAKGLEWPLVFIPSLTGRRFPSSKIKTRQTWYLPRDMFNVGRYEGTVNDERRLFYVAVTRARDVLCVSRFKHMKKATPASPFVESIRTVLDQIDDGSSLPRIELSRSSDEDGIQTFSAGEIISFLKCPHFYRLRELWNYQPGLVTPLGYGKSLHFCLRYASELIRDGESPQNAILRAVREKFYLPYAGGRVREAMKGKAEDLLANFVRERMDDMGRIDEVEARLEFPLQKATITGRVDVIMRDTEEIEARDYKTSDRATTPEESALQVTLYALGLQNIGKPVTKASVATLEEAAIKPVDISGESLKQAMEKAEEAIEEIRAGHFQAHPGRFCPSCDYSMICGSCQAAVGAA